MQYFARYTEQSVLDLTQMCLSDLKTPQNSGFYTLPLQFGGNRNITTYENSKDLF